MIQVGSKGLIVDALNYLLFVKDNTFTKESLSRLKEFQASYRQIFVDNTENIEYTTNEEGETIPSGEETNLLSQYFQPGDDISEFESQDIVLYPNGNVDIYSVPAILGADIDTFDTPKVKQAQIALLGQTKPTGLYDSTTKQAIQSFQRNYNIYQPHITITENKNLLTNNASLWSQGRIDPSTGDIYVTDSSSGLFITSPYIQIDPNYNYAISVSGNATENVYVTFYTNSSATAYINQTSASQFTNYTSDIYSWYDGIGKTSGILPYWDNNNSASMLKPQYIRVTIGNVSSIMPNIIAQIGVQLEMNTVVTSYEPYSYNQYNTFCSGYLNIPTYNKLKEKYGLKEA